MSRHKISTRKILTLAIILTTSLLVRHLGCNKPPGKLETDMPKQKTVVGDKERIGRVKRVIDGDTIVLQDGERIRYIGINTPEIHHPTKGVEYYGPEAAEFNKKLVSGRNVRLEFDKEHFDKYGRTLAYVYLEDGTFVNAELVKQGYARTMRIPPNTKYADLFSSLQAEAKTKKLGLWRK